MNVFSKEKFIETMGKEHYNLICKFDELNWVDKFDGKIVENGVIEFNRRKF